MNKRNKKESNGPVIFFYFLKNCLLYLALSPVPSFFFFKKKQTGGVAAFAGGNAPQALLLEFVRAVGRVRPGNKNIRRGTPTKKEAFVLAQGSDVAAHAFAGRFLPRRLDLRLTDRERRRRKKKQKDKHVRKEQERTMGRYLAFAFSVCLAALSILKS